MIPHFKKVDLNGIKADFSEDRSHRASLYIPFTERSFNRVLIVVGQNPSYANEIEADKTLRYVEEYVFRNLPEFSAILMLNLYSVIDTRKEKTQDLIREEIDKKVFTLLASLPDIMFVTGMLYKQGAYDFPNRMRQFSRVIRGKNILKIDIESKYPPHPGNSKIVYKNLSHPISQYVFEDLD